MQCHDGIDSEAARWIHRLVVRCTVPRYELHLPNPPVATAVNETAACSYIPEFHFHSYHNFNYPFLQTSPSTTVLLYFKSMKREVIV